MRYFSMFSGIGGFELGIQNAYRSKDRRSKEDKTADEKEGKGLVAAQGQSLDSSEGLSSQYADDTQGRCEPSCVGYSEIDKYADSIYRRHFEGHKNYGDARKIDARALEDFDLLVGGFPCQAFSIAGKRGGFDDTRGTLFFEIARIVEEKQPRLLLLENVKGLLSHDKGKTFGTIVNTLDELGYDVQWQVLNSKDFGVPQNRQRVFFIGHLRGTGRPKVFPLRGSDTSDIVVPTLTTRYAEAQANGSYLREITPHGTSQGARVYDPEGLAATLSSAGGGMGAKTGLYAVPVLTPERETVRQNGRRMKEDGDPSFTLTAQDKHGVYDGIRVRRLTPIECERLQGFPDNWTQVSSDGKKVSDSQRYKCLGNAVTVSVIETIVCKLIWKDSTNEQSI